MATLNSTTYTDAYVTKPQPEMEIGDTCGRVRHAYAELVMDDLSTELNDGDVINWFKLQSGCRILNLVVYQPADDTGVIDFGWAANGVDSVSANGIIDGAAQTSAAFVEMTDAANVNFGKRFGAETTITSEVITDFATKSGTFRVSCIYVID